MTLGVDRLWLARAEADEPRLVAHGATAERPWHTPDAQALSQACAALLGASRPGTLRVQLGADLCRHWVLPLPQGLRSWRDLQALAQARAAALFGGAAGMHGAPVQWTVAADWQAQGLQWCAAVPADWIAALRQAAQACRMRLQVRAALQTAWARLNAADPVDGLLAWTTPGYLLLAQGEDARVSAWRAVQRPAGGIDASAARLALAEARVLQATSGAEPQPLRLVSEPDARHLAEGEGQRLQWIVPPWKVDARIAHCEAGWAAAVATTRMVP